MTPDIFAIIAQQKKNKKPLLAVGTTSTRTLESLPYLRKQCSEEQKDIITDADTKHYWDELTSDISSAQAEKYVADIIIQN